MNSIDDYIYADELFLNQDTCPNTPPDFLYKSGFFSWHFFP